MGKKWFVGRSPDLRKEVMADKILELIPKDREASWSVLAEKARALGIGKATLSRHLKRFVRLNILERRVDASTYPPKVYYRRPDPNASTGPHLRVYIPYALATGLFGEPPSRETPIEDVERWMKAQISLLLAHIILEFHPGPFLYPRETPDEAIKAAAREIFLERNQHLIEDMAELRGIFAKAVAFDAERLDRIGDMIILKYCDMMEQALGLYGLSFEKILDMVKRGEAPPLSKPLFRLRYPFTLKDIEERRKRERRKEESEKP
jgi:DNA-binding transcriptional ArsR family regulator